MNFDPPPLHSGRKPFTIFIILVPLTFLISLGEVEGVTTTMRIKNGCNHTVWPGLLTGSGTAPSTMAGGENPSGFILKAGQSANVELPHDWSGRLWGRTGCKFSSSGVGACETGDCASKLDCTGVAATPPATLVEFTLQGQRGPKDFYDVSLVDGFNLPISVSPTSILTTTNKTSCSVASCPSDLNKVCPTALQMMVNGVVVGCKSACLALKSDMYCCSGAFANPNTCKPSSYSRAFKSACPNAYTYAFDDPTSLFTCSASVYTITFCPSSRADCIVVSHPLGANGCANGNSSLSSSAEASKGGFGNTLQCLGITFLLAIVVLQSQ